MSRLLIVILSVIVPSAAAYGHHSFAAEFDANQPVTVTGTVVKVEWTNPHARFYVDTKDESGKVVNWDFELGGATQLLRRGWSRNTLKLGEVVTVSGFRARKAATIANAREVRLADGKRVLAGSSFEAQQ